MDPVLSFMKMLFIAANAVTDEEKARVAWRANDYMWRNIEVFDVWFCRRFNELCQDQRWPKVKDLWSKEEIAENIKNGPTV